MLKPSKKNLFVAVTFLLLGIIGTSLVWVYASPDANTLYISSGVYPSLPTYVVWKEENTYFVKNEYGLQPSWSDTSNFSEAIQGCIDNLPTTVVKVRDGSEINSRHGWIHIKSGNHYLTHRILIPWASRIRLSGEHYVTHPKNWSITKEAGTRILIEDTKGGLRLLYGDPIATSFHMNDIAFIQVANLPNDSVPCIDLNNMKEGMLSNIVVSTCNNSIWETGRGITLLSGGFLTDFVYFDRVVIAGFSFGLRTDASHIIADRLALRICQVGIKLTVRSHQVFTSTQFLTCQKPIGIVTGDNIARVTTFDNPAFENCGNSIDYTFDGEDAGTKVIISYPLLVTCYPDFWTFRNASNWEFHQICVKGDSPTFPTATTPSIPASTVALMNPNPSACEVYITGGTVTGVKVGNVTTGLTSGSFTLYGQQNITLTYSVAPTWKWRGIDTLWSNWA